MKYILSLILVLIPCPTWNAKDCLTDPVWNACVEYCQDTMDRCLTDKPNLTAWCDYCSNKEADCVLSCPIASP